jgi:hypothetical protein
VQSVRKRGQMRTGEQYDRIIEISKIRVDRIAADHHDEINSWSDSSLELFLESIPNLNKKVILAECFKCFGPSELADRIVAIEHNKALEALVAWERFL